MKNKTQRDVLIQENNQTERCDGVTTLKLIILEQHVLKCFIPLTPQQSD